MQIIRDLHEIGFRYMERIPLDKWSLAHDGAHRVGHMTTNIAESVNGALLEVRKLPITALVQHTFYRSVDQFDKLRGEYQGKIANGHVYGWYCTELLRKYEARASGHFVRSFNRQIGIFEVTTSWNSLTRKGRNNQIVKLNERSCTCGKFQGMHLPCSHAIAGCRKAGLDYAVYVDDRYRLDTALKCYEDNFMPIGHPDYWPFPDGPILMPNQSMCRKKGRPHDRRVRNEMDWVERTAPVQTCSICNQRGHNRRSCTTQIGESSNARNP